jgi:hypothetical protein
MYAIARIPLLRVIFVDLGYLLISRLPSPPENLSTR